MLLLGRRYEPGAETAWPSKHSAKHQGRCSDAQSPGDARENFSETSARPRERERAVLSLSFGDVKLWSRFSVTPPTFLYIPVTWFLQVKREAGGCEKCSGWTHTCWLFAGWRMQDEETQRITLQLLIKMNFLSYKHVHFVCLCKWSWSRERKLIMSCPLFFKKRF